MKITIYTKTGCPWCKDALDYLKEKKWPFEEKEVTSNPKYFEEMIRKSNQTKAPTLDIDGEILADSDRAQIENFFKEKGVLK